MVSGAAERAGQTGQGPPLPGYRKPDAVGLMARTPDVDSGTYQQVFFLPLNFLFDPREVTPIPAYQLPVLPPKR